MIFHNPATIVYVEVQYGGKCTQHWSERTWWGGTKNFQQSYEIESGVTIYFVDKTTAFMPASTNSGAEAIAKELKRQFNLEEFIAP